MAAKKTQPGASLAEAISVCSWCPYGEALDGAVTQERLETVVFENAALQEEACDFVRDGRCKLATYAIEQYFNTNQEA